MDKVRFLIAWFFYQYEEVPYVYKICVLVLATKLVTQILVTQIFSAIFSIEPFFEILHIFVYLHLLLYKTSLLLNLDDEPCQRYHVLDMHEEQRHVDYVPPDPSLHHLICDEHRISSSTFNFIKQLAFSLLYNVVFGIRLILFYTLDQIPEEN